MNRGIKIFIVIMTVTALAFTGCNMIRKDPEAEKASVVARVNDKEIKREEFNETFELYKSSIESQYGKDVWNQDIQGKKFVEVVKEQVIEKLILDYLILQSAEEQGIQVSNEDVDKEIESFKEYVGSEEKFQEVLDAQNISEEKFREQVMENLILSKHKEKAVEDVTVSDKQITDYYEQNLKEFKQDKVKASHILLNTMEEAEEVLEKVKAGEDFAELAKEYSKDTTIDLGYFGYGEMVEPFEEAAFSLQPGEVSDIVETQFGYHIIKVDDKQMVDPMPLEQVRDSIKGNLLISGQEAEYNQLLSELRENAEVKIYKNNM